MSAPDLSIVIVSYNTRDLLAQCLEAIPAAVRPLAAETIVVDNGSRDGSLGMLQARFPEVQVVLRPENPGFARSTNLGLAMASGRVLCWLNPDCVAEPGSLATLVRYVDDHPEVGAVGPRLQYPDGRAQPSAQSFPHASLVMYRFLGLGRLARVRWLRPLLRRGAGPTTRSYLDAIEGDSRTRPADWITGACLVTTAQHAREVGPLDEGYFMYCEDTDWCQRVRDRGLEVHYLPSVTMVHHVGASAPSNAGLAFQHYRSLFRYFRRYRPGEFPWLRAAMLVAFAVRGFGAEVGRVIGRAPAHPWWRLAALCVSPASRLDARA